MKFSGSNQHWSQKEIGNNNDTSVDCLNKIFKDLQIILNHENLKQKKTAVLLQSSPFDKELLL